MWLHARVRNDAVAMMTCLGSTLILRWSVEQKRGSTVYITQRGGTRTNTDNNFNRDEHMSVLGHSVSDNGSARPDCTRARAAMWRGCSAARTKTHCAQARQKSGRFRSNTCWDCGTNRATARHAHLRRGRIRDIWPARLFVWNRKAWLQQRRVTQSSSSVFARKTGTRVGAGKTHSGWHDELQARQNSWRYRRGWRISDGHRPKAML